MKRLLLLLFVGCASTPDSNVRVLDRLIDALNRHDVDGQFAQYASDVRFVDGGQRVAPNKERSRSNREFEAANNAKWSYRVVGRGEDTLEVVVTETMELYDLLGVGPRSHRARYRFRDGKIVEVEAWDWTQRGRPYAEARDTFTRWAARERAGAAAQVMRDGRLLFNKDHAAAINQLVREWRTAESCRLYHPSMNTSGTRIVFSSDCAGPWGIYVASADGSMPQRITPDTMDARLPNWSPDGGRVAFQSNREGNWDIYVVDVDGRNLVRLTDQPAGESSPAFSPDGKYIVFVSDVGGANDLFLIPAAGGERQQITRGAAVGFRSVWAPNGSHVLYRSNGTSEMSHPGEFHRVTPDGTSASVVGGGKRREFNQTYSPDGAKIAFDAHRNGQWESSDGGWEIWLMNADGTGRRPITHNGVNDWGPSWSPDGRTILFLSGVNNVYDIYTMNADGSNAQRLTWWTSLAGS